MEFPREREQAIPRVVVHMRAEPQLIYKELKLWKSQTTFRSMIKKTTFAHVLSVLWKLLYFLAGRSELTLTTQSNSNHVKTIIYTFLILFNS